MFRVSCPNWSAALCWHLVLASNRNIDFAISLERFIYLYNLNKQYHDYRFEHRSKFNKLSSAGERANAKHARARVGRRAKGAKRKLNEEKSSVLR